MRCQNPACGQELEEGSAFCRHCGTPVPEGTWGGDAPDAAGTPEEGNAAGPQAMFCEQCGAPLTPGSMFCERCGTPLSGADADGDDWEDLEAPADPFSPPAATGAFATPETASGFGTPASATGSFDVPVAPGAFGAPAATGSFVPPAGTGAFEPPVPAAATGSFAPPAATGGFEMPPSATGAFAAPAATGPLPSRPRKAKIQRGTIIAVVAAVVAVAVGVGAVLLLRGNGGGGEGGNPFAPHELTEEKAAELASKEAARVPVTHPSVSRDWIGEQEFVAGDMAVDAIHEPSSSASDTWSADLTLAYESDAVAYERSWELTCAWDSAASDWEVYSLDDLGASDPHPTRGITDEELVAGAATLLTEAKAAPDNTEAHNLGLADCYANGFAAVVDGNLYDDKSDAVKANVKVTGSHGLGTYRGTLSTDLSWVSSSGGTSGWTIDSCIADADAWHPDYAPLTCGNWNGVFKSTEGGYTWDDHGKCYGGRAHPAAMTVKSVDSVANTMMVDLFFVAHIHPAIPNDAETVEGDQIIELRDVLVTFSPGGTQQQIYENEYYDLYLTFPADGQELELMVVTNAVPGSTSLSDPTLHYDEYSMVHEAPAPEQQAADPAQQQPAA